LNIAETFAREEAVYMAHVYYGDPNENFSLKLIKALCENGVDIIEFGIPFSDPTADGPVFQRACERALNAGMTPRKAINGIKKLRKDGVKKPIIVTSYYNIIFHMGVENFMRNIKEAGADGLIAPNVPFEEADSLLEAGEKHGIDIIFLIAPTTPEKRFKEILKRARGFVYVIAVTGVTGARESLQEMTLKLIKKVHRHSKIPFVVGFGISELKHVKSVITGGADGVITGSAIGRIYEKYLDAPEKALPEIKTFAKNIKDGCREGIKVK